MLLIEIGAFFKSTTIRKAPKVSRWPLNTCGLGVTMQGYIKQGVYVFLQANKCILFSEHRPQMSCTCALDLLFSQLSVSYCWLLYLYTLSHKRVY